MGPCLAHEKGAKDWASKSVRQNGHTFYGHTGGDLGIASLVYRCPDVGYSTIILSNRDPRDVRVMTNVTRALMTRRTIGNAVPPPQKCVAPPSEPS